mmetsp:Transcript_107843/g.207330  ORF Transcript_107843/g.207330 Transcript_107843/m.207330 type:complete len:122 (-) Transcript_107843:146-511(-)
MAAQLRIVTPRNDLLRLHDFTDAPNALAFASDFQFASKQIILPDTCNHSLICAKLVGFTAHGTSLRSVCSGSDPCKNALLTKDMVARQQCDSILSTECTEATSTFLLQHWCGAHLPKNHAV